MKFILLIPLFLLFFALFEYRWLRVVRLTLAQFNIEKPTQKSKGKRIVFLADIQYDHAFLGFQSSMMKKVIAKVNELKPDLVIIGGDMIHDKHASNRHVFAHLKDIVSPVIAVLGNHDYRDLTRVSQNARDSGITILRNEIFVWHDIQIVGVDDYTKGESALPPLSDAFTLLVTHNPDFIEDLPDGSGIDMALAAHLHGGQINLFGWYAPVLPSAYGQKYRYGAVANKGFITYVTSGLGGFVFGWPLRFFARPEVVVIDF